jgi:hypothetical protein
MIALYILWTFAIITFGGLVMFLLDLANDNYEQWQKNVRAEDLRELDRLFDKDTAFVDYNDKGEKFLVGYLKNN